MWYGDFFLFGLLQQGLRDESGKVDAAQAKKDAEAMLKAGPEHWGTDVKTFTDIFATRNFAQLRETFREYERIAGTDVQKSIKSEMSGELARSFLTLGTDTRSGARPYRSQLFFRPYYTHW
jgi:hypothetical protein